MDTFIFGIGHNFHIEDSIPGHSSLAPKENCSTDSTHTKHEHDPALLFGHEGRERRSHRYTMIIP